MSFLKQLFSSAVVKLAGGVALANLINLVFTPVLTYFYSPEAYGQYALFLMFITIGNAVNTLKLEQLFMNETDYLAKSYNLQAAVFTSIFLSFILSVTYSFLAYKGLFGFQNMPVYFGLIIFVVLLGVAGYVYFRFLNLKSKRYNKLGWLETYKAIGRIGIQVVLGLLSFKGVGLAIGEAGGRFLGIYSLIKGNGELIRYSARHFSLKQVILYLQRNRSFFIYATSSSLINVLNVSLLIPTLSFMYGEDITGKYSFVYRVLSVPITLIGATLADVLHEKVSNRPDQVKVLFNKYSRLLFLVSISIFIPAYFIVEPLSNMLLDEKWAGVGEVAKILLPWFFGILTVSSLSRILFVVRKEKLKFIYDFFSLFTLGVVFFLSYTYNWDWQLYLKVVSSVWVLNYIIYYFTIRYAVTSYINEN